MEGRGTRKWRERASAFLNWFSVICNTWKRGRWCWIIGKQPSSSSFFPSIFLLGSLCIRIKPASHKVPPTGLQPIQLQPRQHPTSSSCDQPTPFTIPWFPPSSPPMCLVYDDRDRADDLSCTVTPCPRSVGQIREYRSSILWKYVVFIQIPICQDCARYSPRYFYFETITLFTPLIFLA